MNIKVKEHKLMLDGKVYVFRLDFRALAKLHERYNDATSIFNEFIQSVNSGKDDYILLMKILACACNEDISQEELYSKIPFSYVMLKELDAITLDLISSSFDFNEKDNNIGGKKLQEEEIQET